MVLQVGCASALGSLSLPEVQFAPHRKHSALQWKPFVVTVTRQNVAGSMFWLLIHKANGVFRRITVSVWRQTTRYSHTAQNCPGEHNYSSLWYTKGVFWTTPTLNCIRMVRMVASYKNYVTISLLASTYIHTYIHTHIHTYTHTYMHSYTELKIILIKLEKENSSCKENTSALIRNQSFTAASENILFTARIKWNTDRHCEGTMRWVAMLMQTEATAS